MLHFVRFCNIFEKKKPITHQRINNLIFYVLCLTEKNQNRTELRSKFKNYYSTTFLYFFLKITWRGKAYRVRLFKKYNKFTFNFGYSHWTKLLFDVKKFQFFKIKRQNYLVLFKERFEVSYITKFFDTIRTMNRYTKRGIRIKTTPYMRRFGKVSQVSNARH